MPPGQEVLINRKTEGRALYTLTRVRNNEFGVMLPSGKIASFAINFARPYYTEQNRSIENSEEKETKLGKTRKLRENRFQDPTARKKYERCGMITQSRARDIAQTFTHHNISEEGNSIFYRELGREKINALQEMGYFQVVLSIKEDGHHIYRSPFVDYKKPDDTKRSQLCVAACNDEKHGLSTAEATIKQLSLIVLLFITMTRRLQVHVRNVTKTFNLSKTPLRRPVYMRQRPEKGLAEGKIVKAIRPV